MPSFENTPVYPAETLYPPTSSSSSSSCDLLDDEPPSLTMSQASGDSSNAYPDDDLLRSDDATKRRRRTTPEELAILEQEYSNCTLPDAKNRARIGNMTNMSARSVQIWFQNKRQTDKRKAAGITRRSAKRSVSSSALSITHASSDGAEYETSKKKRKTLDEFASEAQRRGPTSPEPLRELEMNAALAIARLHSAPFNPHRAAHHPGMARISSTASLPSFPSKPSAPPALVRAFSMPQPSTTHTQDGAPIWTRMLSSPQTSPFKPQASRKRPFELSLAGSKSENDENEPAFVVKRAKLNTTYEDVDVADSSFDCDVGLSDSVSSSSGSEPITPQDGFSVDPLSAFTLEVHRSTPEKAAVSDERKKEAKVVPNGWESEAAELLCFLASGRGEARS